MRMQLLRLGTIALAFPLLMSCQTRSDASSSEIKDAVKPINELRVQLHLEFCRGQVPQQITREQYDLWPQDARDYVVANANQFLGAGCKV